MSHTPNRRKFIVKSATALTAVAAGSILSACGSSGYGLQVCMGSGIYQCNMTGPGFQRIAYCGVSADACDYVCQGDDGNEYRCVTGSANPVPRCAACLNTCGQGEDVVNCANQVVVDCDPAFSWCSHGRGGDIRRRLPGDLPLWEAVCEPLVTAAPPGPRTMITPTDTLIPPSSTGVTLRPTAPGPAGTCAAPSAVAGLTSSAPWWPTR